MNCVIEYDESAGEWIATVNDDSLSDPNEHVAFLWAALQILADDDS